MKVSATQTTARRGKLFGYIIRRLSRVLEQPWRSLFSLLGFALRFAIAFPVCFWLYSFLYAGRHCFLSIRIWNFFERLVYCPLFAWAFTTGEFFDVVYEHGVLLPQVLVIASAALVISIAWGAICRRRFRATASPWPQRGNITIALKQAAADLTTMVRYFVGRFAIATPICWCIYAWLITEYACREGLSELCRSSGVMAPLRLLSRPIAYEGEDPPNDHEPVLLLAMMVTVIWTLLALLWRCL